MLVTRSTSERLPNLDYIKMREDAEIVCLKLEFQALGQNIVFQNRFYEFNK